MTGYIYKLVCPIKNEPIYVGATTGSLRDRLSGHKTSIKSSNLPLYTYLRNNNVIPTIHRLATVSEAELKRAEKRWFDKLTKDGCELLNCKKMRKTSSGSVFIEPSVLDEVASYCRKNGKKISFFATEALREKLQKEITQ